MSRISDENVQKVMDRLPPEARAALNVMSEMQKREPEDVLRDEIRKYIEGKIPSIDLEGIVRNIKETSYSAGYLVGRVRNFARRFGSDD